MAEFVKVARVGEIAPGEARAVEAGGKRIALFNVDGTFYCNRRHLYPSGWASFRGNGCGRRSDLPVARCCVRHHERSGAGRTCTASRRPL
jgi:hypothetical protein